MAWADIFSSKINIIIKSTNVGFIHDKNEIIKINLIQTNILKTSRELQ